MIRQSTTTAMIQAEKAAASLMAPRSLSCSTETEATWVFGVIRKTTADSDTIAHITKNTPIPSKVGQSTGSVTLKNVHSTPVPGMLDTSSKLFPMLCRNTARPHAAGQEW